MERLRVVARRIADRYFTRRRAIAALIIVALLLYYIGPFFGSFRRDSRVKSNGESVDVAITRHSKALQNFDARLHPSEQKSDRYTPYVGNGYFGLSLVGDPYLNIKDGRTLSLPVYFHPIVVPIVIDSQDATISDYTSGIVYKYSYSPSGYEVVHAIYAHRAIPSLLMQQIRFSNPTNSKIRLSLKSPRATDWSSSVRMVRLRRSAQEYELHTGTINSRRNDDSIVIVTIISPNIQPSVDLDPGESYTLNVFTVVQYSDPISRSKYEEQKTIVEKQAIETMERVIELHVDKGVDLKYSHIVIWDQLWYTGFSISESRAVDALNGDKINATIYNVLSQVRSLEFEEGISSTRKTDILRTLTYSEGCYEGHYTLQADNLWKSMENLNQINSVVGAWLLTLEKRGCHHLLKAGASGVMQAMVLSFGGLRFSNQHLEFNIHPSDLHRDFHFRRVNYGNLTHVNISVVVQEDNKAALYVALDRSDRNYYACDAGCLDSPIQLGPSRKYFPVKLTDPITAVLYITSDKQHMEDLRHAIHVKEVVLAPAHEHHVIALHKHGHSLGALPTLFWVTICFIIVVFHLFLCRIIMTEYCESSDKYRRLYSKP